LEFGGGVMLARFLGERGRLGGGGGFIGGGDRPRFAGPQPGAQGCGRRDADSKSRSGATGGQG
jgi:hypothetical protein